MSRSLWAVFLAAIFGLMGTVNQGSSPSKVEGRAKSEPQANFVGAVLDQTLRAPVHKIIGGTAALAPAEGVHQLIKNICATTSNTVSVKLSDLPVGKVVQLGDKTFVKVSDVQWMTSETAGCLDLNLPAKGSTRNFDYTGNVQSFTVYPDCEYKLEVWGAQGGSPTDGVYTASGGKGGYSTGALTIAKEEQTLFVYVGGAGNISDTDAQYSAAGGWNGGGSTNGNDTGYNYGNGYTRSGGGGGATDISIKGTVNSTTWNDDNHLLSRIIVAGGGGGGSIFKATYGGNYYAYSHGGAGGGENGLNGSDKTIVDGYRASGYVVGYGGTQTSAGEVGANSNRHIVAGFGYGASKTSGRGGAWWNAGAGGGGWYGGGCGGAEDASGGGGSGYVFTASTVGNYPSGCLLDNSYYLTNTSTISGDNSMPNPRGSGNITGNTGNGYARITRLN